MLYTRIIGMRKTLANLRVNYLSLSKSQYNVSNLLSTRLISTLFYQHEYGKDIHEKPADCTLIHVIDDIILFVLKEQAISLRLSVVSFILRRLGI